MEKILSQKFIKRKKKASEARLRLPFPVSIATAFGVGYEPLASNLTISGYGEMLALFTQYFLDYRGEFRFQFLDNEVIDMSSQQLIVGSLNIQYSTSSWLNYNTEYRADAYPIPSINRLILPVGNNGAGSNFDRDIYGNFFTYIPPIVPGVPTQESQFSVEFSALVFMVAQATSPLVRFQIAINNIPIESEGTSSYLSNGGTINYSFSAIINLSPADQLSFLASNLAQPGNLDPLPMYIQSQSIIATQLF